MPEFVSEFLTAIAESRILLIGAAFLLAIFGYAIIKRLLKLALFLAVFLAAYSGLVYYFG